MATAPGMVWHMSIRSLPWPVLLLASALALPGPALAQNPLARKAAPDPFTREYVGEELQLRLQKDGDGYRGSLVFGEQTFPARAGKRQGDRIEGTFAVDGEEYSFRCTLAGDVLTLVSDGVEYTLRAKAEPATKNPLARGRKEGGADAGKDGEGPGGGKPALAELEGVWSGAVAALRHPDGLFTAEMPKGWSIAETNDEAMVINPGFTATDTLDCLLLVTWGELDEGDRGVDVVTLFERSEQELLDGLRQQGIETGRAKQKPRKVAVGDRAGAEQIWDGRAQNGALRVWCGGLVEREYYLAVVAIVMNGKDDKFLPGARRLFRSLQPKAPERNEAAERSLAGATFGSGNMGGSGGSFHAIYEFRADGSVKKQLMLSGTVGGGPGVGVDVGGDTEESGRFRAVGNLLYLQFKSGQEVARIESEGGRVTALRFGKSLYRRR